MRMKMWMMNISICVMALLFINSRRLIGRALIIKTVWLTVQLYFKEVPQDYFTRMINHLLVKSRASNCSSKKRKKPNKSKKWTLKDIKLLEARSASNRLINSALRIFPFYFVCIILGLKADDESYCRLVSQNSTKGKLILSNSSSILDTFYFLSTLNSPSFIVSSPN